MKNTPAFQFYPSEFLANPEVRVWNLETVGAFWILISYLWVSGGECEFNLKVLARLFNVNKQNKAAKLWDNIKIIFLLCDGIITNKRILEEMQKQARSRFMRQQAGKKGAQKRWGDDGNATVMPMAKNSSPSPTPIPTPTPTLVNSLSLAGGGDFELCTESVRNT